jgi:protein O-GlcNAc transferase
MTPTAIARNAPCPCGSGRRYKDCHGAPGAAAREVADADSLLRQAQVAFAAGQAAAAKSVLARAIELSPERTDLLRERARVEWTLGDAGAEASCRAALERAPRDIAAWNLLGEIKLKAGDVAGAEAAWRETLRLDPADPEALFHLGNRLRERAEHHAAIEHYQRALERAPGHAGVLNNLGLTLEATGQVDSAENCYRQVLAAQSQHADALANLATLLQSQKRYRESVLAYEQALAVRRDFPVKFWISRAIALDKLAANADAEASLREAARLEPDNMRIQLDIGALCIVQGKFDEAEAPLSRALELDPGNPYAAVMLTYGRMQRCAWQGLEERFAELRRLLSDPKPAQHNAVPFPLLAMPLGPELELAAARRYAQQIAAPITAERLPAVTAERKPVSRMRVGFVSSDFRDHPVSLLLLECWERIDRSRIETFAYGLLPPDRSPLGQRIVSAFDHFVEVYEESAEQTARRIRADGVEVLIDLNGYTTHARSEIFALKPAPVQISWLGYLGTLGAPWYDYVLTDRFAAPAALQPYFSERFLYLPDCYCPSDTRRAVAATPSRAACGLPERALVFCCFNNSYKILPEVFALWLRLLAATPESVLWLAPGNATAGANLRREAAARGIDPQRLVLAPRVSLPEHLARHAHAELFLDTTPYNAGTTANDALFMGVPVLTCAGATMVSRVAGSQLRAAGLPELVTANLAEYEALALKLTAEPTLLQSYRSRLLEQRQRSPLFDMARFTHALDDLLLAAWENRRTVEIL